MKTRTLHGPGGAAAPPPMTPTTSTITARRGLDARAAGRLVNRLSAEYGEEPTVAMRLDEAPR